MTAETEAVYQLPVRSGRGGTGGRNNVANGGSLWDGPGRRRECDGENTPERTGTGKLRHNVAYKRHGLVKRPQKMKRKARGTAIVTAGDAKLIRQYMPYSRG